jgi:hypothetical protein
MGGDLYGKGFSGRHLGSGSLFLCFFCSVGGLCRIGTTYSMQGAMTFYVDLYILHISYSAQLIAAILNL